MSITAKEIAKQLGLSTAAVSMALNNRPGVSTETRRKIIEYAEANGFDFSRLEHRRGMEGEIHFVNCQSKTSPPTINIYPFIINELLYGIQEECKKEGLKLVTEPLPISSGDIASFMEDLRLSDCIGLILLGTAASRQDCEAFISRTIPMVLLDTFFEGLNCDTVLINNEEGAYLATDHLLSMHSVQPGRLRASTMIPNFAQRQSGFLRALKDHGMPRSNCITHELTPTIEGAMTDMLEIIDNKEPLARCYFADNDTIAIGAIKALKLRGYRIPDDIAVIGFDNTNESRVVEPALSTVSIPRQYMGRIAMRQLVTNIREPVPHHVKIEVSPSLVRRFSV